MAERRASLAHHGRTHRVRPRLVWLSLLAMLAGAVVAAVGLMGAQVAGQPWVLVAVGAALLVVGGFFALRGGFFYDVIGGDDPATIIRDVKEDTVLEGPDPDDRRVTKDVAVRARATEEQLRALRARPVPMPPGPGPGVLVVASGLLLMLAQGVFPDDPDSYGPTTRVVGFAILVLMVGLRLALAPRSWVSAGIAVLLGLVVAGVTMASDLHTGAVAVPIVELSAAALAVIGGTAALVKLGKV
jgi:hypothetical protein